MSTLGSAAALAVLALTPAPGLPLAMGCLTAALALQAFCSAGFHPYIQVCCSFAVQPLTAHVRHLGNEEGGLVSCEMTRRCLQPTVGLLFSSSYDD